MADTRLPVLDAPDDATFERIAIEASKGSDANLPLRDRRDRARISDRTDIAPGTVVAVGGERMRLHGPGRGNGWAVLAWTDGDGDHYGTFHEAHVPQTAAAPRTEPVVEDTTRPTARPPRAGRL
jgi:hypothetical protein